MAMAETKGVVYAASMWLGFSSTLTWEAHLIRRVLPDNVRTAIEMRKEAAIQSMFGPKGEGGIELDRSGFRAGVAVGGFLQAAAVSVAAVSLWHLLRH